MLCAITSTAGCSALRGGSAPPRVEVVRAPVPPELLEPVRLPPLPERATWADLAAYLASEVPAAIGECNARLEAIRRLSSGASDGRRE